MGVLLEADVTPRVIGTPASTVVGRSILVIVVLQAAVCSVNVGSKVVVGSSVVVSRARSVTGARITVVCIVQALATVASARGRRIFAGMVGALFVHGDVVAACA